MEQLDNSTTTTTTDSSKLSDGRIFGSIARYLFLTFVCLVLLCDIFTCIAIKKTKRVPFPTKLLTCITLMCDSLYLFISLLAFSLRLRTEISAAIFTEFGRLFLIVSWLVVTILSLERVFCLYHLYLYSKKASQRNVTVFVVVCIGSIVCITFLVRYVLVPELEGEDFDFVQATKALPVNTCILAVCLVINTMCYIAFFQVIKKHMRLVDGVQPNWSTLSRTRAFMSTKNVTCIIIVFQLVHVPLLISLCVLAFRKEGSDTTYLTVIFMLIMCAVNPVLYAWRFKECRFTMLRSLNSFCSVFNKRVETMRMEVYDIAVRDS